MRSPGAYLCRSLRSLRRSEDGAVLVEFGLTLPIFLLFFAMAIEGSRTFWSYQATISGVRDAARYIGRSVQSDLCTGRGGDNVANLSYLTPKITSIVRDTSQGVTLFPSSIRIKSVTPSLACMSGNLRLPVTPVATVTARLEITYPFASVFSFLNLSLPTISTSVSDSSRVYGA